MNAVSHEHGVRAKHPERSEQGIAKPQGKRVLSESFCFVGLKKSRQALSKRNLFGKFVNNYAEEQQITWVLFRLWPEDAIVKA